MEINIEKLKKDGFTCDGSFEYSKKLSGEWRVIATIYHSKGKELSWPILYIDGDCWCYIDSVEDFEGLCSGEIDPDMYYDENK